MSISDRGQVITINGDSPYNYVNADLYERPDLYVRCGALYVPPSCAPVSSTPDPAPGFPPSSVPTLTMPAPASFTRSRQQRRYEERQKAKRQGNNERTRRSGSTAS